MFSQRPDWGLVGQFGHSLDRAEQGGTNARPVSGNLRWTPTLIDIDRRRSAARYVLTGDEVILKHNQHTYHRLPDGILFLWEQNLGIRYVLCQEAVTNYPPQLWPLCNWLVKMSRKFLQNTKVPHCWYFSDTRFISFVTLMGLLTIKNHFCYNVSFSR